MAWFLTSPTGRIILAVLAAIALFGGYTLYVYDSGRGAAKTEDLKATIETQKKIDDAQAHGPRTPDAVDQRLRDGSF